MPELEAKRDLLCAYAVSGQYCYAPRILYYAMVGIIVLIRRHMWLAAGASAYIMTYAGVAAVHAVILCGIHGSSTSWLPDDRVSLEQEASVWVRGLVLDMDTDATLAIVAVGFLMLLPLAAYSTTFQKSEAKPVLTAWGVLMLVGLICCLTNLYILDTTLNGPFSQYRICNMNTADSLSSPSTLAPLGNDWNETVHDYFANQPTTSQACFYPCLYSSQILRSQSDITMIPFPDVQPGSGRYWAFKLLAAFVYACVPLYIVGGVILLFQRYFVDHTSKDESMFTSIKGRLDTLGGMPLTIKVVLEFIFVSFQAYALVFSPLVVVVFVIFAEFSLSLDPEAESMRHVGQWQPLVSVALVVIAALLSKYSQELKWLAFWRKGEHRDLGEPTELYQSLRVG